MGATMKKLILAALAAAMLAGCATTYGDMGLTGGVDAAPMTNDTFRISARGNGFTDATTIQDYAMLKAAETTLAAGKTHFAIITGKDVTNRSYGQTSGTINTSFIGNTAFTTYNPGYVYDIVKPGEDLMIRVFTPAKGAALPANAFNAQEIFDNVNPRIKRSK
jgi:hypothetical protein